MTVTATRSKRRKYFTRDHTVSARITNRDKDILLLVARYRFVSSDLIATYINDGSHEKIKRRTRKLFHAGYLDRPRAQKPIYVKAGSTAMVYGIGNKGVKILVDEFGFVRRKVDWTMKNRTALHGFIEHTLMLAKFFIKLEIDSRKQATG